MRDHLERAIKERTLRVASGTITDWQNGQLWKFVMEVLYVAGTLSHRHILHRSPYIIFGQISHHEFKVVDLYLYLPIN